MGNNFRTIPSDNQQTASNLFEETARLDSFGIDAEIKVKPFNADGVIEIESVSVSFDESEFDIGTAKLKFANPVRLFFI